MPTVRVGLVKIGNIGSSPLLEALLDERADREDINVRVVSTGAKLDPAQAEEATQKLLEFKPDLLIAASPNATLPGPAKIREIAAKAGVPTIVISDSPSKKAMKQLAEGGFGYIIVEADAMIGARREFLDPVEMVLFNTDIMKVLAVTGVFRLLHREIDSVVESLKRGEKPALPQLVVDKEKAAAAAGFQNPYAQAKALAAYEISRRVADLDVEGCFVVQERERYIPIVAAAHEMMRLAARLADEAREIEKNQDTLLRTPHYKDGTLLLKRKLWEKPQRPDQ
ncbi:MAG: F420-dependent methylenetetrahydromethanopterin dehydrogenase [Candidatus Bathyarchaeia archaeon]